MSASEEYVHIRVYGRGPALDVSYRDGSGRLRVLKLERKGAVNAAKVKLSTWQDGVEQVLAPHLRGPQNPKGMIQVVERPASDESPALAAPSPAQSPEPSQSSLLMRQEMERLKAENARLSARLAQISIAKPEVAQVEVAASEPEPETVVHGTAVVDYTKMTIEALSEAIVSLSKAELEQVLEREQAARKRHGAIKVITEAIELAELAELEKAEKAAPPSTPNTSTAE